MVSNRCFFFNPKTREDSSTAAMVFTLPLVGFSIPSRFGNTPLTLLTNLVRVNPPLVNIFIRSCTLSVAFFNGTQLNVVVHVNFVLHATSAFVKREYFVGFVPFERINSACRRIFGSKNVTHVLVHSSFFSHKK